MTPADQARARRTRKSRAVADVERQLVNLRRSLGVAVIPEDRAILEDAIAAAVLRLDALEEG